MYRGDFRRGQTVDFKWTTYGVGGESITRATNGTVSVYKGNSDTQTTTGVTDTEDFDSLTGVHHCRIATTDSFYEPGYDYMVVLSAATIDGETVNALIAEFSIENRFQGEAVQATAQSGAAGSITLASTESSTDDAYNGDLVLIVDGTGEGQARQIVDYTGSSRVAAVDRNWFTTPDNTSIYRRFPGSLGSTIAEVQSGLALETTVDAVQTTADAIQARTDQLTFSAAGFVDANVMEYNDNGGLTGDGDATPIAKA